MNRIISIAVKRYLRHPPNVYVSGMTLGSDTSALLLPLLEEEDHTQWEVSDQEQTEDGWKVARAVDSDHASVMYLISDREMWFCHDGLEAIFDTIPQTFWYRKHEKDNRTDREQY